MRQRITIPRGDTALLTFHLRNCVPSEDDRVVLSVRREGGGLVYEMTAKAAETVQFPFTHDDTERMREGVYRWDVRYVHDAIIDENGRVTGGREVRTFYRDSTLEVTKVVTKL